MTLTKDLFKTYDIRGKTLDHDTAYLIGRAFGSTIQTTYTMPHVVVGGDMRHNSDELQAGLIEGLVKSGCVVIALGYVATPVLYLNAALKGCAGVMTTASHLGKEFNGFKFVMGRKSIFDQEIQALYTLASACNFSDGAGQCHILEGANEHYIDTLARAYRPGNPLKLVVDAGNGMASLYIEEILSRLGHTVTPLYTRPDFSFPHHEANPADHTTLTDLIAAVKTQGADLGLAFDGDADRVGVVDDRGRVISADRIAGWLATDILKRNPAASVVADVMTSQVVFDMIEKFGGNAVMSKTGHAYVRSAVQNAGALFGSEVSGHMFFADRYYGFDDGIYAAGRVVELVSESGRSLSESLDQFPTSFTTPVYRPHYPPEIRSHIIQDAKARLEQFPIVELDGLRITFPNGCGILRLSNTEPVLSLRFEAATEDEALRYKALVQDTLRAIHPAIEAF